MMDSYVIELAVHEADYWGMESSFVIYWYEQP